MVLIVANIAFSQQVNPPPTFTNQDYLQKSKHQKTAAKILLGGGGVLFFTGSLIALNDIGNLFSGKVNNPALAEILLLTGGAAMVTSIPLFIASSKNKKKAMSMSLGNQSVPQIKNNSFVYRTIPSLTIKISL